MTDSNNPNNPWAPKDQPADAQGTNEWNQASTPGGATPAPQNPWGEPAQGGTESTQPAEPQAPAADPWGQPAQPQAEQAPAADPWGQPAQPQAPAADPYGQPSANQPYGQPSANDQWTQPAGGYGDPNAAAYGAPGYAPQQGYGAGYPQGYATGPVLASWGKRAQGYLLDWILPGMILGLIFGAIFPASNPMNVDTTSGASANYSANWQSIVQFLIIAGALTALIKNGQTPGRKWAGTQLVDEQGQPVTNKGLVFGRYVAHFLDTLACFLGWLWPLWDKNRQTFADKIVKTRVIDLKASGIDPNQPRM